MIELSAKSKEFKIAVATLNTKPDAPDAPGQAYQYFDISVYGIINQEIERVSLEFRVKKSWLAEHRIDKSTVALYRFSYDDFTWKKLSTAVVKEDSEYVYYSAASQGFSYFVIAGEKGTLVEVPTPAPTVVSVAEAPPVTTPAPTTAPPVTPPVTTPAPTPVPTPPPKPIKAIVGAIIAIALLAIAAYWIKKKKAK